VCCSGGTSPTYSVSAPSPHTTPVIGRPQKPRATQQQAQQLQDSGDGILVMGPPVKVRGVLLNGLLCSPLSGGREYRYSGKQVIQCSCSDKPLSPCNSSASLWMPCLPQQPQSLQTPPPRNCPRPSKASEATAASAWPAPAGTERSQRCVLHVSCAHTATKATATTATEPGMAGQSYAGGAHHNIPDAVSLPIPSLTNTPTRTSRYVCTC
jgi:hypothetical protein